MGRISSRCVMFEPELCILESSCNLMFDVGIVEVDETLIGDIRNVLHEVVDINEALGDDVGTISLKVFDGRSLTDFRLRLLEPSIMLSILILNDDGALNMGNPDVILTVNDDGFHVPPDVLLNMFNTILYGFNVGEAKKYWGRLNQ